MVGNHPEDSPRDLDEALDGLRDIEEQLTSGELGFEATIVLQERKRELKELASKFGQHSRTRADVEGELDHLRRMRDSILGGHVSVGHMGGGNGPGGGGIEPRDVFAINEAIDTARGRAELERRIEKLEVELAELDEGPSWS